MKVKKELDGICLNCKGNLQVDDQFCPRCGQKVDRNDLSLRGVFSEFFENYLSLDSRLGRTLIPFFFRPGYLTSQFINGVRRSYANPFRLYIFSSLFFFFCLNAIIKKDNISQQPIIKTGKTTLKKYPDLTDKEVEKLNKTLKSSLIGDLNSDTLTTFSEALKAQKIGNQQKIVKLLADSTRQKLQINADSILKIDNSGIKISTENEGFNADFDLEDIEEYRFDETYTDQMLYDSLTKGEKVSMFEEMFTKKIIRVFRSDQASLSRQIFGNLSLAMFVLIPIYAFFLMLFYYRKNKYYVAHLIHTIYLQSFAFFIFGMALFFNWLFDLQRDSLIVILKALTLIFGVYFVASFRIIYKQGWFKLLLKSFLLILTYFFLGSLVFLGEVIVSFLLF